MEGENVAIESMNQESTVRFCGSEEKVFKNSPSRRIQFEAGFLVSWKGDDCQLKEDVLLHHAGCSRLQAPGRASADQTLILECKRLFRVERTNRFEATPFEIGLVN